MQFLRSSTSAHRIFGRLLDTGKLLCCAVMFAMLPGVANAQTELTHERPFPRTTLSSGPYGIISTIAGNSLYGSGGLGGPATQAYISSPQGLAVDQEGNIYIAAIDNEEILKVSATTGIISLFAGSLESGYSGDNGPALEARLSEPRNMAFDNAGDLYFVDLGNNVIRMIAAKTNIITTVVGDRNLGPGRSGDGGPADKAQLNYPEGIAFDSTGSLYISDTDNYVIRRVDSKTKLISTVAGEGDNGLGIADGVPAIESSLNHPAGLRFDSFGNLYIADTGDNSIRRIDAVTGLISTVAGSYMCNIDSCNPQQPGYDGDGGPATLARLNDPDDIVLDSQGNLYIADLYNGAIRRVDSATGIITTTVGQPLGIGYFGEVAHFGNAGDGGLSTQALISLPENLALDASGNLLIADEGNYNVRRVSLPPTKPTASPILSLPFGLYAPGTKVTLSDATPGSTIYYTVDGSVPTTASPKYSAPIEFAKTTTVTAFATSPGLLNSVGSAGNFFVAAAPTITPAPGSYNGPVTITLNANLPYFVTSIFYTTDGSSPLGATAGYYSGPFTINQTTVVQAVISLQSGLYSPVAKAIFTIKPQVAPPSITPAVGSYPTAQSVTLADSTAGASIYYTTNGTAPTTASTKYTKAIPVAKTTTIEAIATATGDNPSPVVSGAFTIQALPIPTTGSVTALTANTATLNGGVNREGVEADYWFVYGISATSLTSQTPIHTVAAGTTELSVNAPILDLTAKTPYYFQLVSANASGTARGAVHKFTTP